jgi:hypothetical protein
MYKEIVVKETSAALDITDIRRALRKIISE